ncbi:protein AF-10-like isoform X1 [Anguilla anguilla]|uniref:protein AF-10-like isoform X1 n=1 Tax=Anguilla anguilla TaxID=7936 RepID=UPI0015ADABE0|nr:protein AF-10-like isoform X1 [Anguilla anguilla]
MVSSEPSLEVEDDYYLPNNMKEMIGGCCVCSDERGWAENPLVYCDGHGCNVAVHQACYGIVQVPTGPWFCRKCESQERAARVIKGWKGRKPSQQTPDGGGRSATHHKDAEDEGHAKSLKTVNSWRCELCPHKDGALKRTDNGGWAHVVCALYIPEVEFANVSTMEPIVLQSVPHERYNKTCYICEEQGRESKAATGACMTCNKHGCRQAFHVTCAQFAGLLCEEQGSDADNVKYCGYCKYHYSKLKHKERDKHKPRHKRSSEPSSSVAAALTVSTEKTQQSYSSGSSGGSVPVSSSQKRQEDAGAGRFTNANFQEVPSHPGGVAKDGPPTEGKSSEGKGKRTSSHSSGQRGRKSATSKPPLSAAVSAAPPTATTPSSSPFQQGVHLALKSSGGAAVAQPAAEFLSFSESDPRNDSSYAQPSFARGPAKPAGEGGAPEGAPPLSAASALMSLPPAPAASGSKPAENSRSASSSAGYKRSSSSSSSAAAPGEDGAKVKKKRGKWRNRYGPCWSLDPTTPPEPGHLPQPASAAPALPSANSAPSATNPSGGGGGLVQKSPSLLRNGSLQSHSVSSSPAGPGSFSSSDALAPLSGMASSSGVTLGSAELPQPTPAGPSLPSTVCSHSSALPGSSFNLAPPHMFGNRLNPNSAMASLFTQSESSPADPDLGFSTSGASPKSNLSPRSPVSGLQIRYDPPGAGVLGSTANGTSSAPPVANSIEQLLERQWNEGQQFLLQQGTSGDLLGMLKSLHQLQVENRRLEEQIRTLTVKKERLQLLSAQLSVPFPPASSAYTSTGSSSSSPRPLPSSTHTDVLNSSKSPQLGSSFLPDSTLPLAMQDPPSGGRSSSVSSLSTPPSLGHDSPQPGQQQLQVNGVVGGALQATPTATAPSLPALPGVTGLMGAIQGGQLAMNGIVGALNGVIQTSPSLAQSTTPLPHPAAMPGVSLTLPSSLGNSGATPAKTSTAGLGLISEQQRQILLHQHQLQQLFPTPEQQTLLYQLMQQQQQQQHLSSSQLPISSLLPAAQGAIAANPFLAMHAEAAQKTARLVEKGGAVAGQEKS